MNWTINKNGLVHYHNPIHVFIDTTYCPLCKESVPKHICIQRDLLFPHWKIFHYDKEYLDFFINYNLKNQSFGWFYYPKAILNLNSIISDKHTPIIELFKENGFNILNIRCPLPLKGF